MRILCLLLLCLMNYGGALRILMFNPGFGHSHMRFMGGIADILIEAGHELTEIRPSLEVNLKWKGISKTKDVLEYPLDPTVRELIFDTRGAGGFMSLIWTMDMSPAKMATMAENMTLMFTRACENLVFETTLLKELKTRKFDMGISESFDDCGHGIFEAIGLRTVVTTSSSNIMDHQSVIFGVPRVPSYVPGSMSDSTEKMSITERLFNAIGSHFGAKMFLQICDGESAIFQKHLGPDFPSLRDLVARSALLFTNSQPYIDFPKPTLYKVIDIGGIHINDNKPTKLSEEWNQVLGKRKQTVLISFGSVAKSALMPPEYKQGVLDAVRSLPDVGFIWKYEEDDLFEQQLPENLYLSKWTPQTSLLADPRLSLFLTHGGLCSTIEIAYSGTPSLVIPLFADQSRNAQVLIRQGIAQKLFKFDLKDGHKLAQVIGGMLAEKSYKEKAVKLSELLQNVPFKPKDLLLRNIEFVAKFGLLPQLDPYGRQLNFIQYFNLDVFALLFVILFSILLITILVLKKCLSFFVKTKKKID